MFRSLWFWLIALVLVPALTGVLWFVSDFDLQAQDARMRAAGLPATLKERPQVTPSATTAALLEQIAVVARSRRSECWPEADSISATDWDRVRERLARLPGSDLDELAHTLRDNKPYSDGVGCSPVRTQWKDGEDARELAKEVTWRLRVGVVQDAAELRHLLVILTWLSVANEWGIWPPRHLSAGMLCGDELNDSVEVASWLRCLARECRQDIDRDLLFSYWNTRELFGGIRESGMRTSSVEVLDLQVPVPDIGNMLEMMVKRWRRGSLLAEYQDWMGWVHKRSNENDAAVVSTVLALDHAMTGLGVRDVGRDVIGEIRSEICQRSLRLSLWCELFASFIDNGPWPIDPWGDGTARLNPIRRNGAIIGGYSLGPDRIDNGGVRESDWCFPLAGPLGSPKAADLPEDGVTTWRIPPPDASVPASPDPVPRPPSRRRRVPSPSSE